MTSPIHESKLPNGITVTTERLEHVETVSLGVYVHVGSRNEKTSQNGIAHFLEHMAFKGTPKRSARKIAEDVENIGGFMNACTSREQTIFYMKLLKEHISLGIDILGDIMNHSLFEPQEIERERGVILQEIGQSHDTPDDIIFDYYQECAFPKQPIGRPILGTTQRVKSFSRSDLIHFMSQHYRPQNIVIAAAGALDHDQFTKEVEQQFSSLTHALPQIAQKSCYHGGSQRIEKELDQAHMILGFEAMSYCDDDYMAALILSTLLGGGMSSRLFQEIREKRGLVYTIFSSVNSFHDNGLFTIYGATGEEECSQLLPVLIEELRKVQEHVTDEELRRSQSQLKSALLMSLESTDQRCDRLARHLQLFGRHIPIKETIDRIETVTAEKTCQVAQRIFSTQPTFTALGAVKHLPSSYSFEKGLNS